MNKNKDSNEGLILIRFIFGNIGLILIAFLTKFVHTYIRDLSYLILFLFVILYISVISIAFIMWSLIKLKKGLNEL